MRYLPLTATSRKEMLERIGVPNVDALFEDVPKESFVDGLCDLPMHKNELEVERHLSDYASKNISAGDQPFFLGAGTYYHHVPATVDYIIQRSEFLTAYTPYQPEIAQGTLQMIYEFQTMIAQLTGQDIANASLYDGATSCAEAALMSMRLTKRDKIAVGTVLHPHYREVLDSYLGNFADAISFDGEPTEETAAVIIQSPDFHGTPHAFDDIRAKCDAVGAKLIVVVNEIISLGLLPAPACADIVCGEAQSIGLPMSYGGPHLGFFACKKEYLRQMPGRLCGETVDEDGKRSFVLTLSTREQHIRREKATSNICTNQGLCALAFTVHMALLGESGLKALAKLNHSRATSLYNALKKVDNIKILNVSYFNEFVIEIGLNTDTVISEMLRIGIIAGYKIDQNKMLVTATEMTKDEDIVVFCDALKRGL
jgi:glycine dehydrogenase subunit 1